MQHLKPEKDNTYVISQDNDIQNLVLPTDKWSMRLKYALKELNCKWWKYFSVKGEVSWGV